MDGTAFRRTTRLSNVNLDLYISAMEQVEQQAEGEVADKKKTVGQAKSAKFPQGEEHRKYMERGIAVDKSEFPVCCNPECGHPFLDHPESNLDAQENNKQAMTEYLAQMEKMKLWKQNKQANPQPTCPTTGKLLTKIPLPEVTLEYVRCHCKESKYSARRQTSCYAKCEGYELGKCPICRCTCDFFTDVNSYRQKYALMMLERTQPEQRIPSEEARAFLDTSSNVRQLTSSASVSYYQRQIAGGNMAFGTDYSSQVSNDGALGQALYMLSHPPSGGAQGFLRQSINALSHPQGRDVVDLTGSGNTVSLREFGRTSAVHSRGYLTGTGVVGNITGAGINDRYAPSLPPVHEYERELYELADLFDGDEEEMLRVGILQSIGTPHPSMGNENNHTTAPNREMQQPSMGNENNHTTTPNQSIGTSKTVTERVRKRASDVYFSNDDTVSPNERKQAGKVRKGLATGNSLYTSVIVDASPSLASVELYRRALFTAERDDRTPQKKRRKRKEESPTSDSSDSEH